MSSTNIFTNEIGGTGLNLVSLFRENSTQKKGEYITEVSIKGQQLLFVIDENEELRGLTLSTPNYEGAEILPVNALSTATSVVFMTPSISDTDPLKAQEIIENIQNLSAFTSLKTYLSENLLSKSLNKLILEATYNSLLSECIEEYLNNYGVSKKRGKAEGQNLFTFNQKNDTEIELSNSAYRYVRVAQRDLNSTRDEIGVETKITMGGARPLSWGSIFTGTTWDPTVETIPYSPGPNVSYSEFWVVGMGFKEQTEIPPASIAQISKASGATIIMYLVVPIIDLVSGAVDIGAFGKINSDLDVLLALLDESDDAGELLFTVESTDLVNAAPLLINLVAAAVTATLVYFLPSGAGQIAGLISIGFGAANLTAFLSDMAKIEKYTKFAIYRENLSNLLAHYSFNSNADDVSGNGYNAALNGPVITTDRFSNTSSACFFDGDKDYIEINNKLPINGFPLSVSAWIKPASYPASGAYYIYANDKWDHYWGSYKGFSIMLIGVENAEAANANGPDTRNNFCTPANNIV